MTAVAVAHPAAEEAGRRVAEVRDDPAARMRLAADTYSSSRYRPYARAVLAFMRWQDARGVLDAPFGARQGSPWWRAVNEDLLRDTYEARLLVDRGGEASRPTVARWVDFFQAPSAMSWYLAHNGSIVEAYLAHRDLAAAEPAAERFFMNVVLLRVLYVQALVSDGDLALGRLSFLGRVIGHPRTRSPEVFLAMADVLPAEYPIEDITVEQLIALENPLGRLIDYAVIAPRIDALYAFAADALHEPRLLDLVFDGTPGYVWPRAQRHAWRAPRPRGLTSVIGFLTRTGR